MTTQKRGPSPERIKELKRQGYSVHMVVDQDPVLYGWMQLGTGNAQGYYKAQQPYRRTKEQAWADCDDYASLSVPDTPNPDWDASEGQP
ncbi:hypothetical protein [Cupriavidus sp. WS]|uniref:hypothetical protein n=1 Tax=Cupriavidus sp. WS TaxID=1312922 RepID=UPI0012DC3973|nr:hypothetical protein [Cupriavidus sp. WS]